MRQFKISKSITNRTEPALDKYLQDISRLPMVSIEEEVALVRKIKSGNSEALQTLVSANLRFVVSVAKQYQNKGIDLADLINEGNVGLIKAASRFDETRGFKFISYAIWWIRQSIMQAISEQSRVVRLPLNKINLLSKIRNAQRQLEQELERLPASAEISGFLEMDEQDVVATIEAGTWYVSMDQKINESSDTSILDLQEDRQTPSPDARLMRKSLQKEVVRSLNRLSDREKAVIALYYGIEQAPVSLFEIAEKFNLTRERVRQIREGALGKLRKNERNHDLRSYLT